MGSILLTGGAGFIGAHTAIELIKAGFNIVLIDNYSNSRPEVIEQIEKIVARQIKAYEVDVADITALNEVFCCEHIDAVMHFAGYKAVGESVQKPVMYYRNNIDTTLSLLEVMAKHNCKKLIFSSSATVYGGHSNPPYTEDMPVGGCTNPYGWTKYMIEQILTDAVNADPAMSVMLLRYFNPIGAHESGLIGEKPKGIPNNLMPYITQTAMGLRERLNVYGNDYPTPDGTGIRDYIHIVDLAKGHLSALKYSENHTGSEIFNIGTGIGYSVLDVVKAFKAVTGINIPYVIVPRRPGDLAICYANPNKAEKMLGWNAKKTLEDMCRDSWRWQQNCNDMACV